MPAEIVTLPLWEAQKVKRRPGVVVVSTVSKAAGWMPQLSPFTLGPCPLYNGMRSLNMENAWQYSKVYPEHLAVRRGGIDLAPAYWEWAWSGWTNHRAVRYPMGRGKKPLFSYWAGECLGYIEARKRIYAPLYYHAVIKTDAWLKVLILYREAKTLVLLDYDAYDTRPMKTSLVEVLNNPYKKMGHAFVLRMMLEGGPALQQLVL